MPEQISRLIEVLTGIAPGFQSKIVTTLAILLLVWISNVVIAAILSRRIPDVQTQYRWRKVLEYGVSTMALFLIARTWFAGIQSIATFLGLLSAGVAVALKDPLVNLAGWGFILWRKPFDVGDRIQLGDYRGDVNDIRLFSFTLMEIGNWVHADQSTGRIIHIPNGKIFTEVLANYSRGFHFIWNELPVLVTFESDWKKAHAILEKIARDNTLHLTEDAEANLKKASRKMLIFYNKLEPAVYVSVEECGVLLTIRYLCSPKKRRGSAQDIWKAILDAFAECDDIDFAYPTQRVYFNPSEGKPAARAELSFADKSD